MGSGRFDSTVYSSNTADTASFARSKGLSMRDATFRYSTETQEQPRATWKAHPDLDPLLIKGFRESRDSDEHPTTIPVAAILDVTGSMRRTPQVFQEKLPKLMTLLTTRGKIEHPHVLFGAVGDYISDRVPFQVGQFESDNRCDNQLRNLLLEGGGGGSSQESYELALYFAGYKTSIDSWEKREHKGYLFTFGDEMPYPNLSSDTISKVFGDVIQKSLDTDELIERVLERFEYFHVHVREGQHGRDAKVIDIWRDLIGQRLLFLDDSALICETIAGVVATLEGDDAGMTEVGGAVTSTDLISLRPKRKINAK